MPPNARACPECGSDEQTGWSEEARTSELGLPEEEFDYHEFVRQEFGKEGPRPRGVRWFWWVIAIVVAGLLLAALL